MNFTKGIILCRSLRNRKDQFLFEGKLTSHSGLTTINNFLIHDQDLNIDIKVTQGKNKQPIQSKVLR